MFVDCASTPLFRIRLNFSLLQHEVLAGDALPDIMNVFDDSLEMRCSVVGTSDVDVITHPRRSWRVQRADGNKSVGIVRGQEKAAAIRVLLIDGSKELKSWSNLHLWPVRFDDGADNCDINVLGTDIVRRGHHSDINV